MFLLPLGHVVQFLLLLYPQFSLLCSPSTLNTKYLSHPSGETNPIKLSSDAQHWVQWMVVCSLISLWPSKASHFLLARVPHHSLPTPHWLFEAHASKCGISWRISPRPTFSRTLCARGQQSFKSPIANIVSFVDYRANVAAVELCQCSTKAAREGL